ncbi:MAG: hypothetical protein H7338_08290 [Candidatus Sericytochromatia bacterium]|nr:hypothetical protein [Candidatus Sericytochromatia bacterium]
MLQAQFSETMALFPGNMGGVSIPADSHAGYVTRNTNFRYFVSPVGSTQLGDGSTTLPGGIDFALPSSQLSGCTPRSARFDDGDPSRMTIELAALQGVTAGGAVFGATATATGGGAGGATLTDATNLVTGDLVIIAGAVANTQRITGVTGNVVTWGSGTGIVRAANGQTDALWTTANTGGAANGAMTMTVASSAGLAVHDVVMLNGNQRVRITAILATGTITFAPALTATILAGDPVAFQSAAMGAGSGFSTGNNVWLMGGSGIIDPAGNELETSNNVHIRSGIAI